MRTSGHLCRHGDRCDRYDSSYYNIYIISIEALLYSNHLIHYTRNMYILSVTSVTSVTPGIRMASLPWEVVCHLALHDQCRKPLAQRVSRIGRNATDIALCLSPAALYRPALATDVPDRRSGRRCRKRWDIQVSRSRRACGKQIEPYDSFPKVQEC